MGKRGVLGLPPIWVPVVRPPGVGLKNAASAENPTAKQRQIVKSAIFVLIVLSFLCHQNQFGDGFSYIFFQYFIVSYNLNFVKQILLNFFVKFVYKNKQI
jgi:hypothetical protein